VFSEYTDTLFTFASAGGLEDEIRRARGEFFADVKDVYAEEEFFEERINAFLEWYTLDRTIGRTGKTPLDLFLERSHSRIAADHLAYLEGLRDARHAIFELQRVAEGRVDVRDAFTGERFAVTERRPLVTLRRGDLCETRLVPHGGDLHFSRTFLIHPRETRRTILREIRRAKGERRLDAPAFMRTLAVLWVRSRRYKGVDPHDLYSPAEVAKPNAPLP
jgi:hypothetical protein